MTFTPIQFDSFDEPIQDVWFVSMNKHKRPLASKTCQCWLLA
jgi:hypothetical protein